MKSINYSIAAKKREERFRSTIMFDGRTLKEHIIDKSRKKLSNIMKQKIADGTFTPNVTNSWANSKIRLRISNINYNFRSSWEALFWLLNQNCHYEKVRIPYTFNGNAHTYIVDFVDQDKKILYEVKPDCGLKNERVLLKEAAAQEWCKENGYQYYFVTNRYFLERAHIIKELNLTDGNVKLDKSIESFIKETNKCNRQYKHPIVDEIKQALRQWRIDNNIEEPNFHLIGITGR